MASYLIYIPGKTGSDPQNFTDVGLADVCGDVTPDSLQVSPGPDGGRGLLAGWRKLHDQRDVQLAYKPEHQTWVSAPPDGPYEAGRYWLGMLIEGKVDPSDVARQSQHGGAPVTLADGNDWIIPTARFTNRKYGIDRETGMYVRTVPTDMEEYFSLSADVASAILASIDEAAIAELVAAHQQGDDSEQTATATISCEDAWNLAVKALVMNYHLNAFMISELGLVDDHSMGRIGMACIEALEIVQTNRQKKTESESVTVPVG